MPRPEQAKELYSPHTQLHSALSGHSASTFALQTVVLIPTGTHIPTLEEHLWSHALSHFKVKTQTGIVQISPHWPEVIHMACSGGWEIE